MFLFTALIVSSLTATDLYPNPTPQTRTTHFVCEPHLLRCVKETIRKY